MERPICTNETAIIHAGYSAQAYLGQALEIAHKFLDTDSPNPIVLAALIDSQTKEYASAALADAIYELAEAIKQLEVGS